MLPYKTDSVIQMNTVIMSFCLRSSDFSRPIKSTADFIPLMVTVLIIAMNLMSLVGLFSLLAYLVGPLGNVGIESRGL